ncbi:uncharacterized protein LOC135388705 [Ornithodoros turicata]
MAEGTAEQLKQQGNDCMKAEKYAEAIFHYTHAIKRDPNNSQLYSNRSLAFLKMDQFYLAYVDANETIRLNPKWAKGWYRKAEVEYHTQHFEDAIESFRKALQLSGEEPKVIEQVRKCRRDCDKQTKAEKHIPWVGAAVGFVIGVLIVVFDVALREKPLLLNPALMTIVVMICAAVSYLVARLHRNYLREQRKSLLEPPVDLLGTSDDVKEEEEPLLPKAENIRRRSVRKES